MKKEFEESIKKEHMEIIAASENIPAQSRLESMK
jgi:hypothetical protein